MLSFNKKSTILAMTMLLCVCASMQQGPGGNNPNPPPPTPTPGAGGGGSNSGPSQPQPRPNRDNVYGGLKGVWRSEENGCYTLVNFNERNFGLFNLGGCGRSRGVYMGTFSILRRDLLGVQLMMLPKGVFHDKFLFKFNVTNMGLRLENVENRAVSHFRRVPPTPMINGIWKGENRLANGPLQEWSLIDDSLSIAHTLPKNESMTLRGLKTYFTLFRTLPGNKASVTYLQTTDNKPMPGTTVIANVSGNMNMLKVEREQHPIPFNVTLHRQMHRRLQGVWSGKSKDCVLTTAFNGDMFRSYSVCRKSQLDGGNRTNVNAFFGVYRWVNQTTIKVGYGYTTRKDMQGTVVHIKIEQSPDNRTYVSTNLDGPGTGVMTRMRRVQGPPLARTMRLRLAGRLQDFNGTAEARVIRALAARANISEENILVLSKTSGSIILEVAMVDEQNADGEQQADVAAVESVTELAGFQVLSAQEDTDGQPSATPTPTPTPSSSASPSPTPTATPKATSDAASMARVASWTLATLLAATLVVVM